MKQHRYTVKGTVSGSRCYEDYMEWVSPEELTVYMEEISALFTRDPGDELAQYIWDESPIHGVVTEIWVGVKDIDGTLYSWTEITSNRELTEAEKDALLDYLAGQFSDGYGEGLEQQAFNSYTETVEMDTWDEETQEWYMSPHDLEVNMYLHLWQLEDFKLEFVNAEDYEVEKPKVTKPRCKLIGEDGNIFNLIGIAARSLRKAGLADKATEMSEKVMQSKSYEEALSVIMEYVEVE